MLDLFSGTTLLVELIYFLVWSKILEVIQPVAQEIGLRGDMFIYFKKCSAFLPSLFYFVSQEEQTFTFIFSGLFIVDLPIYVLPNPS